MKQMEQEEQNAILFVAERAPVLSDDLCYFFHGPLLD